MAILEVQNLTYIYSQGTPYEHKAVDNVSFSIERGECVAVIGHTGSGKSTLIGHLNGLFKPTSGKVLFDGEDIFKDKKTTHSTRFKVGLCFQYPEYQLFEESVYKDIAFGPKNMGLSDEQIDVRVKRACKHMGIPESMFEKSPFDLSGGEKRRVAIAGILSVEPQVLVLDEPTAGLDPRGRESIFNAIKQYKEKTGTTVVLVSHSMEDVAEFAQRIIVINDGSVAMDGTTDEVYSRGDELVSMGLSVPKVTSVFLQLKKEGYPVNTSVYSTAQAIAQLRQIKEAGNVQ